MQDNLLLHLLTSFMASLGFALYFNVPRRTALAAGFTGMAGWFVNILFTTLVGSEPALDFVANLLTGLVTGILAQFFSRRYKAPPVIFYLVSIIPPVPGGSAYMLFYSIGIGQFDIAATYLRSVLVITTALLLGILLASYFFQEGRGYKRQFKKIERQQARRKSQS